MARNLSARERLKAQDIFIETYSRVGVVTDAAKAAGVPRERIYQWQEHDETFALRFNLAKEAYCDTLRREIHRRAIEGVEKPVYQRGFRIDTVREYSDALLMFHAKAKMPEYRQDSPATEPAQKAYVGFDPELV